MPHLLPDHLRQQLTAFRRRLFMQETLQTAALAVGALAGAWVMLFVLDRFFDTDLPVRLLLWVLALGVAVFALWRWARNWMLAPRDDRRLALLVQKKYRKLGDTLLGAIELAEGRVQDESLSPELRHAAIGSVAAQAAGFDFLKAVDWRRTLRLMGVAGICLLVLAVVGAVCWPALRTTWWRLANPFAAAARHTFTKFAPLPSPMVVARGEPFEVPVKLDSASQWLPEKIHYQAGALPAGEVFSGSPIALMGMAEPTKLEIWAGDGRFSLQIQPEDRPALGGLSAKVFLPDYLQLPPLETPCGNSLSAVRGARVELAGGASRALEKMQAQAGAQPLEAALMGSHFVLAPLTVDQDVSVMLRWADKLKLAGAAPHEVAIKAVVDGAPQARCTQLAADVGILPDEVLRIPLEADDDFGVKQLSVHFTHALDKAPKEMLGERSVNVQTGGPDQKKVAGEYTFSPRLLNIPEGSTVYFQAGGVDYFPRRLASLSQTHRIVVLTKAAHAKLLQDQMAQLVNKIEEAASLEQQLKEETDSLSKQPDDSKKDKALAAHAQHEKDNAKAMRQLGDELAEITKQALRNSDIKPDALAKMEKIAANIKQASESESPAASKALDQAKASPQDRKEDLKKAAGHQQKAADALREASKDLEQTMRRLDADSFVNRLTKESEAQKARVAFAKQLLPATVGQSVKDMDGASKKDVAELVDGQQKAEASLRNIEADLLASYARMHHGPYLEVTDTMDKEKVFPRNDEMIAASNANQLFAVMGDGRLLAQLYADLAEKLKEKGGGGGGGGGGKGQQLPPEVVAALMRILEKEQDLRWETRSVGANNADAAAKDAAQLLGSVQMETLGDLVNLVRRYQDPPEDERAVDVLDPDEYGPFATLIEGRRPLPGQLLKLLDATAGAMHDAAQLLEKGDAGAPSVAAETEAIELLAKIFQSGDGKPNPSGGMMQKMAQQMASGSGNKPGRGQSGNGTAQGRGDGTDQTQAPNQDRKQVGGEAGGHVPPEFQGDIEAFRRQMDKLQGAKP